MNEILEIIIFIFRILIAIMLIPFVFSQWKIRHQNGLVGRLRRHTMWNTVALSFLFFQTALFRYSIFFNDSHEGLAWEILSLIATLGVFFALISGTKLFSDIHKGNIHEQEES